MYKKLSSLLLVLVLLTVPVLSFSQASFISNGTGGGVWNNAATWVLLSGTDGDGIPDADDDAIISGGDVVTYVSDYVDDLTVVGTLTWSGSTTNSIRIQGNLSNLGSIGGNSTIYFQTSGGTISGSGYFGTSIRMRFQGNRTISSGVTAVWNKIASIYNGATVTNEGDIRFQGGLRSLFGGSGTFINGSGGILRVRTNNLMTTSGILDLNNTGNTVIAEYTTNNQNLIDNMVSDEFYNLTITTANSRNLDAQSDFTVLNDFSVVSGAGLDTDGNDFSVGGDFDIDGTLDFTAGDILTMNGTALQLMDIGTQNFQTLIIDNPTTVRLNSGTANIITELDLDQGTFDVDATLIINSDASGTARIDELCATCDIDGTVTVERQIFGGAGLGNYTDMAVPFASGATLTEWDDDFYMSCVGGDDGDAWGPGGCYVSVKTYDDGAYSDMSGIGDALDAGRGYEVWLAVDLNDMNDTLVSVDGVINDPGSISPPQTFDVGWNLVGNPYASQIDFDDITKGAGIGGIYVIFDSSTGNYEVFGGPISSSQGFWVEGLGGDMTFDFTQSCKTASAATYVKYDAIEQNQFSVEISSKHNDFTCESVVNIDYSALESRDREDVSWLRSWVDEAPFIGTQSSDGVNLRINALSTTGNELNVPVVVRVGVAGDYTITFDNMDTFNEYSCITLEDIKTGQLYNLRNQNSIRVSFDNVDVVENRFIIHMRNEFGCNTVAQVRNEEIETVTILPNTTGAKIRFDYPQETQAIIRLYDLIGQEVMTPVTVDAHLNTTDISVPENLGGVYLMVVSSEYGQVTRKVMY